MSTELGQLVISLVGDYSQLQKDIEAATKQALKQAQELEKIYTLSPSLDTKSLQSVAETTGVMAGKSLALGIEKGLSSHKFSAATFKKIGSDISAGIEAGMKAGEAKVKASAGRMATFTSMPKVQIQQTLMCHSLRKYFSLRFSPR